MATFNFPASPTVGQIYTPSAGISYTWTGTHWDRNAGPVVPVMPAGVYVPFAGTTPPAGTLLCDGKLVSRSAYPLLFAAIGTLYGVGDGTTTFGLPDLRGRVPFGLDNMGGSAANRITLAIAGFATTTLGAVGGDQNIPLHLHGVNITSGTISADHTHAFNVNSGGENVGHQHHAYGTSDADSPDHTHSEVVLGGTTGGTAAAGSGRTNSTVQTGGASARHTHVINFWTGDRNQGHVHNVAGSTGGVSTNHTHNVNGNSDNAGTGTAANVPPAIIANYIIFTGA